VGGCVHAQRQPAYHAHPALAQCAAERTGTLQPSSGRLAGADEGDHGDIGHLAAHEERGRGIRYHPQPLRVACVGQGENTEVPPGEVGVDRVGIEGCSKPLELPRCPLGYPDARRKLD
jgi:hypothetical protein